MITASLAARAPSTRARSCSPNTGRANLTCTRRHGVAQPCPPDRIREQANSHTRGESSQRPIISHRTSPARTAENSPGLQSWVSSGKKIKSRRDERKLPRMKSWAEQAQLSDGRARVQPCRKAHMSPDARPATKPGGPGLASETWVPPSNPTQVSNANPGPPDCVAELSRLSFCESYSWC
jgi:hypothetical protein